MGLLHHRKLLNPEACGYSCPVDYPFSPPPSPPSPPSPPFYASNDANQNPSKHGKIATYLLISFALVAIAFFGLCCFVIYAKFFSGSRWRRRRALPLQQTQEPFVDDEEHGPVVDHPIWYIRTTGLQQSIIGAITVCKYKRGEGLIEGTECSVCLSEFQEDENLRLLPKCNHAFHLPCIDTWLRSHTNCPMCRAPIVTDPTRVPSMDPNAFGSSSFEIAQMEVFEESGETSGGRENGVDLLEEDGQDVEEGRRVCETQSSASEVVHVQRPRRSVSLDSSSAAKINLALATVVSVESNGNSKRVVGNGNLTTAAKGSSSSSRTRSLQSEPSSMKRSGSFNAKHFVSSYSRSQRKPNAPLRSF